MRVLESVTTLSLEDSETSKINETGKPYIIYDLSSYAVVCNRTCFIKKVRLLVSHATNLAPVKAGLRPTTKKDTFKSKANEIHTYTEAEISVSDSSDHFIFGDIPEMMYCVCRHTEILQLARNLI